MNTIAVTASGFALSGPLVAGEPVAVSVSGVDFADGARPCLTIRARFPNVLLASADLAWDASARAWTGTLYTATKQTVLAFLTARADEARPVALELLDAEHSESIARISASMLNSSLLPTDNPPDAQGPQYLGVPGERGADGKMTFRVNLNPTMVVVDGIVRVIVADGELAIVRSIPLGAYGINFYPGSDEGVVDGVFAAYFVNGSGSSAVSVCMMDGDIVKALQPGGKISAGYASNAGVGGGLLWYSVIDEGAR